MDQSQPIEVPVTTAIPFLRLDVGGVIRVGSTRVTLDLLVAEYEAGMPPEEIVRAYDTLRLTDVSFAIAYYLQHRDQVTDYVNRREAEAKALRSKIERVPPCVNRAELLARSRDR